MIYLDTLLKNDSQSLTILLTVFVTIIYFIIICYLLYYFFKHRKIFNSLLDLDTVFCQNHSVFPEFFWSYWKNVNCDTCYECIKIDRLKKCKIREHAQLILLKHYLNEILTLCKSCNLEQYIKQIAKYIWLVENTIENFERIYLDEDTRSYKVYGKICQSYDYLVDNCNSVSSYEFNVKVEDIEYLEKINNKCFTILEILDIKSINDINDNCLYILGLFADIHTTIEKLKSDIGNY
jgi:hypothetical protein